MSLLLHARLPRINITVDLTQRPPSIPMSPGRAAVLKLQEQQLVLVQAQKRAILESRTERESTTSIASLTHVEDSSTCHTDAATSSNALEGNNTSPSDSVLRRQMSRDERALFHQKQLDLVLAEKRAMQENRRSVFQLEQKRRVQTLEPVARENRCCFVFCFF